MSDPVQTATNAARAMSLSFTFASPPTAGNAVIVAVFGWAPSALPRQSVQVVDQSNGNNTYSLAVWQTTQAANGGTDFVAVFFGTPRQANLAQTVTFSTTVPFSPFNLPYFAGAAFERANMALTQADGSPSYVLQTGGGSTLSCPVLNPTANNDFAVAVMTVDANATWTSPGAMTVAQSIEGQATLVNGEVGYRVNPLVSFSPTWSSFSPNTNIEQAAFVLFLGASAALNIVPYPLDAEPAFLTPSVSGTLAQKPLPLDCEPQLLMPTIQMPSWYSQPLDCTPDLLMPTIITTGTLTVTSPVLDCEPQLLMPTIAFTYPALRIKRGPLSLILNGSIALEEGEPFEAGIVQGGISYTLLFIGGHDGAVKLVGGGIQTVTALPGWTTTQNGVMLYDTTNNVIYISNGGTWKTISIP